MTRASKTSHDPRHAPRRPTEFRYWENLDKPWAKRLRAVGKRVLGFDPAPPDHVVRTLADMYYDADPLAEAFVDETYLGRSPAEGRALLERALANGVSSIDDPPRSLVELFADLEQDPDWVDHARVELGAKVFRRYGTAVFRFAGAITLEAYSENSVAKPLVLTGAYAGASTRQRFLETAAFWIAVSEPGGLARGAPGRASALRVRIMHVFVRRRLTGHAEWNSEAWGVPISQGDALLTLMGGSFAPGFAMQAMGYRPRLAEIEAMMHFWRYVGHLMGVRPRWYPQSLREAAQLTFVTLLKGARGAGEDGRHLCQSYVQAFTPEPKGPLLRRAYDAFDHKVHMGYTRFFMPPWSYERNGMPKVGLWALHPLAQAPFIFTAETLRRWFPPLETVADRVARASRSRWLAHHMGERRAEYRPAEAFTR
ncbi:MAG: oxygenase MpaB family protein [bacterium]